MSAKYYQEPETQDTPGDRKTSKRQLVRSVGSLLNKCLLLALLAIGGYVVLNAVERANRPAGGSGHGGHPAMSLLSYCMGLVDWDWDRKVEQRIRRNPGRTHSEHRIPPVEEPEIEYWIE